MLREKPDPVKRKEKSPTGTTPTPLTKQARDLFAANVSGKKESKALSQSTLGGSFKIGNTPNKPQPPHPDSKKESKTAARTRRRAQEALAHAKDFPPIARKKHSNRQSEESDADRKQNQDADQRDNNDDTIVDHVETAWSTVVRKGSVSSRAKATGTSLNSQNSTHLTGRQQAALTDAQKEDRTNPFPNKQVGASDDKINSPSKKIFTAGSQQSSGKTGQDQQGNKAPHSGDQEKKERKW